MAKKKPAKPAFVDRVNRAKLERWVACQNKRLHLARLAKALQTEIHELEEEFTELVHALGGPEKVVVRCGFRLKLNQEKVSVKWKDHFIAATSAEKATEILDAQPTKEVLVVEPPKKQEGAKKAA